MDKNYLNVKDVSDPMKSDNEDDEEQKIRVTKSEYITNLNNTTLKNNNNKNASTNSKNDNLTVNNQNNAFKNNNNNPNNVDYSNIQNPLDDGYHINQQQQVPLPNPLYNQFNNPMVNNNQLPPSPFGNYTNQYSNAPQQLPPSGYQQPYQPPPLYSQQTTPTPQYQSPYQQPPQQFNVQYPGQSNMSADSAMYRSDSNNDQGFSLTDDQKKFLIIGALICLVLILIIF